MTFLTWKLVTKSMTTLTFDGSRRPFEWLVLLPLQLVRLKVRR